MKNFLIAVLALALNISIPALGNTNLTCVSKDFNAATVTGSKLYLTFNKGQLLTATLARGSWGCDGYDRSPKKVASNAKGTIYSVNFGASCDGFSYNSRVFAPISNEAPKWIVYNFSYLTDDAPGNLKNLLSCQ